MANATNMADAKAFSRPSFTNTQLHQYFEYIGLNEVPAQIPLKTSEQLPFLTKLLRYHLCKIPFENLDLHYAPVKGVSIDTDFLFNRIVEQGTGRGGYCMQLNNFFARILRTLGYTVITIGARVSSAVNFDEPATKLRPEEVTYAGWGHQISMVVIDGKKYFCDVGFGNPAPTFPVPLEHGFTQVNTGTEDQVASTMKLVKARIANSTYQDVGQELWQYWMKFGKADDESKTWIPMYCFAELEFFPADYAVINCSVSTDRRSVFVNHVVCTKFIMSEDKQHLIGDITLNGQVIKERKFGKSRHLMEIKSEKDRTDALSEYLGVKLGEAEKAGIQGLWTMIR